MNQIVEALRGKYLTNRGCLALLNGDYINVYLPGLEKIAEILQAPELAELKRQLAEAQKDQADAKRYKYLRDTEVLPLRVYEALENNLGETLDLEIDYEIGMKAANAIQADDVAPKVKP